MFSPINKAKTQVQDINSLLLLSQFCLRPEILQSFLTIDDRSRRFDVADLNIQSIGQRLHERNHGVSPQIGVLIDGLLESQRFFGECKPVEKF